MIEKYYINNVEFWYDTTKYSLEEIINIYYSSRIDQFDQYLTRDDGPAKILYDGFKQVYKEAWIKDGILHRLDGPAVRYYYGGWDQFFIMGVQIPAVDFEEALSCYKEDQVAFKLRYFDREWK